MQDDRLAAKCAEFINEAMLLAPALVKGKGVPKKFEGASKNRHTHLAGYMVKPTGLGSSLDSFTQRHNCWPP